MIAAGSATGLLLTIAGAFGFLSASGYIKEAGGKSSAMMTAAVSVGLCALGGALIGALN